MASGTVKVWTPAGRLIVKVNEQTRRILNTRGKSGGSYTVTDAAHVEVLKAHAATPQGAK